MMISSIEKFQKNLTWRVFFKLNPQIVTATKETFGFGSTKAAPRLKELKAFEKDLAKLLQNVKFRKRSNPFLSTLKNEVKRITTQKDMIIPADKTSNNYLVPPNKYKQLVEKEINKKYKKANPEEVELVAKGHAKTAADLEIADRMYKTTPREAFITLKDHKEDFGQNPSVRLINPTKPEIGRVAFKILDDVVKAIRGKGEFKQCISTREVLEWFKKIENKKAYKFINFDIENFYPCITPTLLNRALEWACEYVQITPQQKKIILQASQSFLYSGGVAWVKKGDVNFDIGMGAYHGAQACEIVGLFVLSKLTKLPSIRTILYRDDGLAITRSSGRQQEKIKQAIIQIFADLDLKITIQINLISVNFLDITMDLEAGVFKPYRKPGDKPMYVHSGSNHPPQVLRNLALGINRRLVEITSIEEIFLQAVIWHLGLI